MPEIQGSYIIESCYYSVIGKNYHIDSSIAHYTLEMVWYTCIQPSRYLRALHSIRIGISVRGIGHGHCMVIICDPRPKEGSPLLIEKQAFMQYRVV